MLNRTKIKILVEQHPDGFIAYPLGIRGIVVGEGDTAEQAVKDLLSAVNAHLATFGTDVLEDEPVLDAFVMDGDLAQVPR